MRRLSAVLLLIVLGTAGCGSTGTTATQGGRIRVVAAFYPLAWMVERIGGEQVDVRDLTPPGTEPHDLELDADGVDAIDRAAVAVVMGRTFQPAVEAAAQRRKKLTVTVLDALLGRSGATASGEVDPHVWLDPVLFARLVGPLEVALAEADPEQAASFRAGAARISGDLAQLNDEYRQRLSTCVRRDLVTSHRAFGRLAERYGLRQIAIAGFSPDAEPDPRRLAQVADLVSSRGVTTVFTEELLPSQSADTIARETGARTATLSPLESLSADQRAAGADYLSVMRSNLDAIATALSCGTTSGS